MMEKLLAFLKENWMPVALAAAGIVLLLVTVSLVRRITRRIRNRKIVRASEKDLGYYPQDVPSGVAGLAFQCFLCGVAAAVSFFDRD